MNAVTKIKADVEITESPLKLLRAPFPDHQISKLPKETGAQAKARKADTDNGKWPARCKACGGLHHPQAVHLDYVGHAAATDRLLDTDLEWTWEPMAYTAEGLPAFDRNGGLWIKLTVCGVTRIGYGSADGKTGGDAIKEIIGDALRNSGMRFGMALDLWHKGDLHRPEDDAGSDDEPRKPLWIVGAKASIECLNTEAECADWYKKNLEMMKGQPTAEREEVLAYLKARKTSLAPLPAKTAAMPDEDRFRQGGSGSVARSDAPADPFGPDDEIPEEFR